MKRISAIASLAFIAFFCSSVFAINGVGVYIAWHVIKDDQDAYIGALERGKLVKATILNNAVTRRDTLFKDVAQYPALSFDGKRIAFFRWGVKVSFDGQYWHYVAGTQTAANYLSVMNVDGSGLTNLVQVAAPGKPGQDMEEGVLDWPAGDWIYYEKPTKTGEIWRINANDPMRNELLCKYNTGMNLRRWDLSADARYSGLQDRGGPSGSHLIGGGTAFPLINNDFNQSQPVQIAGCNQAVSCHGNYIASYLGGNHEIMFMNGWDHLGRRSSIAGDLNVFSWQTHWTKLETWLGQPLVTSGLGGADLIRWSANSEKWVIRRICMCYQGMGEAGTNSIPLNWIDKQAINMSANPVISSCGAIGPNNWCADAGDLWIDFGAGKENMWEDVNGRLHFQLPISPIGYTPAFTSIKVTPPSIAIGAGKVTKFSASALDQLGVPLAAQPAFTWTVSGTPASGAIGASGIFTAGQSAGGTYTITANAMVGGVQKSGTAAVAVRALAAGLDYTYTTFNTLDPFKAVGAPELYYFPIEKTGTTANFNITGIGGDNFGLHFSGLIEIPADGQYTLFVSGDDAVTLYIDDAAIASCNYQVGEKSGNVTLTAGLHPITLDYVNGCCGRDLAVSWQGPSITKQAIPAARLFRTDGATAALPGARKYASRSNTGLLSILADSRGMMLDVKAAGDHRIEILNAAGSVTARFAGAQGQRHLIAHNSMSAGIYFAKVYANNAQVTERLLVR